MPWSPTHSNRSHPRQVAAISLGSRSGLRRARAARAYFPLQPHTPSRTLRRPSVRGRRAQRKFLDLGGSAENQGDLRSVVLHKMTLGAQKSTFPVALGVRMTGVDDKAFSQTGESYSMITMPNADSHQSRVLQEDNTELVKPLTKSNTNTPARAL